jgi:hypothetical protein
MDFEPLEDRTYGEEETVDCGTGIEAQRTATLRNYDTSRSLILLLLRRYDISDSNENLRALIRHVLLNCPENERPNGPSRSQNRVKLGLVQWLDTNVELVQQWLLNIRIPNQ